MRIVKMIDRTNVFQKINSELELELKMTAVIEIDMHIRQIDPEWSAFPQPSGQETVNNAARFLGVCRKYGLPVIHVMVYKRPVEEADDPFPRNIAVRKTGMASTYFGRPKKSPYDPGVKEGYFKWDVMPQLGPEKGDYIVNTKRQGTSSFFSTDLEYLIKALGVDTFIIVGINTNNCVATFAMQAADRGLNTVIVSDCTAARHGYDLHQFALQNMARVFGFVLTESEAYEKLKTAR